MGPKAGLYDMEKRKFLTLLGLELRPLGFLFIYLFLFEYWRGGVHTGSTRHCGHFWLIVPAPGDCEDAEVG
jgi:hypothetical protein